MKSFILASIFVLLFTTNTGYAAVFNPIDTPAADQTKPKYLTQNGRMIFFTADTEEASQLKSFNVESGESITLYSFSAGEAVPDSSFYELDSETLIWQTRRNNQGQLWVSDGVSSFVPLSSSAIDFYQEPQVINDILFIKNNNKLFWTDGEQLLSYTSNLKPDPICAFGVNNYVFHLPSFANPDAFFQYNNGAVTPVLEEAHDLEIVSSIHTSEVCLIEYFDEGSYSNTQHNYYLMLSDGSSQSLDLNAKSLSVMGDSIIVGGLPTLYTGPTIKKLNHLDLTESASYSINGSNSVELFTKMDGVWVYQFNSQNQNENTELFYLDENLNRVGPTVTLPVNRELLQVELSKNIDIFINGADHHVFNQGEYLGMFKENPDPEYGTEYIKNQHSEVLLKESSQIFNFTILPNIGKLMNGPWVDYRYNAQGLSINPGVRTDGSRYIYLTFYLYRDGKPLWLAGVSNYELGQSSINIDLYEFNGANYLDTNPPTGQVFGSLQLAFTGCSSMNGTLNYENQSKSLSFNRVDDASFKFICLDQ